MNKTTFLLYFLFISKITLAQVSLSGVVNDYTKVVEMDSDECQSIVNVEDASSFVVGDLVVLIQMQGAEINETNSSSFGNITNLNGAGFYEIHEIEMIDGQNVFFKKQIIHNYQVNGKVQLVRMPVYENAEINNVLTGNAWDGETGGVVALKVNGQLLMNGNIDVSGLGFRGGIPFTATNENCNWLFQQNDYFYEFGNWRGAEKGEGIAQIIATKEFGKGAQANGGGGGNDHNSGGGGGGNITSGGEGGENNEPSTFGCQGFHPGVGGKGINDNEGRVFLGGGGGAGHENNEVGTAGGNGGGIVILQVNEFIPVGFSILANGVTPVDGGGDGTGGGGAGGTIVLDIQSIMSTVHLETNGGHGGLSNNNNGERCFGPGGGGSGGRIITNLGSDDPFLYSVEGGDAGMTINSSSCPDGTNGAQNGEEGVFESLSNIVFAAEDFETIIADFDYTVNGTTVSFFNLTPNVDTQSWTFGDSNSDTSSDPVHEYSTEGSYEVQLIVNNACGSDTITQLIEVFLPPQVIFSLNEQVGCAPFVIDFTNQSIGTIDSYNWTFEGGDPMSSSIANPQVIYNIPGTYDVQLEVVGPGGSDIVLIEDAITITPPAVADFDFTSVDNEVNFINNSTGAITYVWDFGDGSPSSTEENPIHEYQAPGTYTVMFTAIAEYCQTTTTQTIFLDFVNTEDLEWEKVNIFPNPTSDIISIETNRSEWIDVKLYSSDGKNLKALDNRFFQNTILDLKDMPSGIYFLVFFENQSWKYTKLIQRN